MDRAWGETLKSAEFSNFPSLFRILLHLLSSRMRCERHNKTATCDSCDVCKRCPNPDCTKYKHGTGQDHRGRSSKPLTEEERDKRKALELAALGGPRAQPDRAAVTALQPECYVDDAHPDQEAWRLLQLAFSELGVALPGFVLERRPRFSSDALTDSNLDKGLALLRRFVEAGARLVTSDQDASAILVAAFEAAICKPKKTATPDLLSRACTMLLTVRDNEHRRVLRALCAELPGEIVNDALQEAWDKLSPEEQNRVQAEGVELHKPQLTLEGETMATVLHATTAALKRKWTEEEARTSFSRRTATMR